MSVFNDKICQYLPNKMSGYNFTLLKRKALLITLTELKLIASAPIIGERRTPKNGYSTPAAIGIPMALYIKAKKRF